MKVFKVIFCISLMICALSPLQAQIFSLDDNPSAPIAMPVTMPFLSAEDPYGLGLPPAIAGLIGPSPSLGLGFADSDALFPGPALNINILPLWAMDGMSENHAPMTPFINPSLAIKFSVDRQSGGNSALGIQAGNGQAPGDIFISAGAFAHPGGFAGAFGPVPYAGLLPTAGLAVGTNNLLIDESAFGLTAGNGVGTTVGPGIPCPMPAPGTHDNVDAYNDFPSASLTFAPVYYSTHPVEVANTGAVPGDIYLSVPAPHVWPGAAWAPAAAIGLDQAALGSAPGADDIDALITWDYGTPGMLDPGVDYALFSLSPGSASLAALAAGDPNINPGTIFFTDFTGKFWTYLYSPQLGITQGIDFPCLNLDALEAQ